MTFNNIYLDNNATTRIAPEVLEAMLPFFKEEYGNPSGLYSFGGRIQKKVDESREKIASLLNCNVDEIVYTSCGSESDNFAIRGLSDAYPEKRHIITTTVEHPAIKNQIPFLRKNGFRVTELNVNRQGNLNLDELKSSIRQDTLLISCMFANNETGVLFPIRKIGEIAREHNVFFHTDAVQAVGKIPLDIQELPVDLLSFSGHKFHAPKGIGGLFIRKGTKIRPFIIGGHQERSRRGGTENVPYIVAMGRAAELAKDNIEYENTRIRFLRDRLEKGILSKIENTEINGDIENRVPNTTNIGIHYIEGEAMLLALDKHNIAASTGSACASGSLQPSHVLRSMGIPFASVHGSVRFSLSVYNTEEEIDYVLKIFPGIDARLRDLSPFHSPEDVESFGILDQAL